MLEFPFRITISSVFADPQNQVTDFVVRPLWYWPTEIEIQPSVTWCAVGGRHDHSAVCHGLAPVYEITNFFIRYFYEI
jgi:hypothetical protein